MTPLEALMGQSPNVAGFRVWRSRAWALKPKKQQRKLEARTDVGRFVGYTVGGGAYHILEDETNEVFERRDVLMEENSAKIETSAVGPSVGPRLTAEADADSVDGTEGEMDVLDAKGGRGDEYAPEKTFTSDEDGSPRSLAEESEKEDDDGDDDSTPWVCQAPAASVSVALRPQCSKRKLAPKVTWWEKDPKAYLASGTKSANASGCDLHKPPANEKEARARPDWPRWKQAMKEEVAAHKKLGTWSKIKVNNKKHKAFNTRFVFDIKHDAEIKMRRFKARLVAQGLNQVPGPDLMRYGLRCPTRLQDGLSLLWLQLRAERFIMLMSRQTSSTPRWTRRCTSNSLTGSNRRGSRRCVGITWHSMGRSRRGGSRASSSTKSSRRWSRPGTMWTRAFTSGATPWTGASSSSCMLTTLSWRARSWTGSRPLSASCLSSLRCATCRRRKNLSA